MKERTDREIFKEQLQVKGWRKRQLGVIVRKKYINNKEKDSHCKFRAQKKEVAVATIEIWPLPTSQVAVHIHVCPHSNICCE